MRVLVQFVLRHLDFRMPELDSLLEMHGLQPASLYSQEDVQLESPFLELRCPDGMEEQQFVEKMIAVASRAILIKCIYELWAAAPSFDEMVQELHELDPELVQRHSDPETTWCMHVEGIGSTYDLQQQADIRAKLQFLGFRGRVRLSKPDQTYAVMLEHPVINPHSNDVTITGGESLEQIYELAKKKSAQPLYTEEELAVPKRVYFGRRLCNSGRDALAVLNLSKRKYLATTSMDHELSLIMANMACVKRGSMVLDPFVGSGSILVACAHHGGFCVGTDIDVRALRNRQKGTNIFASFEQYGFDLPEILSADNSMYERLWRAGEFYDAIVTDPPYGIREAARKLGSSSGEATQLDPAQREGHIPQTQPYEMVELLTDFLDTAARILLPNGRLVYWLAATYDFSMDDIPTHPCLEIVAITQQPLSTRHGRLLVTMKKVAEYDPAAAAQIRAQAAENVDRAYSNLRSKFHGAYDDDAQITKKMSKRVARRKLWQKMKREADGYVLPPSKQPSDTDSKHSDAEASESKGGDAVTDKQQKESMG